MSTFIYKDLPFSVYLNEKERYASFAVDVAGRLGFYCVAADADILPGGFFIFDPLRNDEAITALTVVNGRIVLLDPVGSPANGSLTCIDTFTGDNFFLHTTNVAPT